MTKTEEVYGEPFYCNKCNEEAMFMDTNKLWWCSFNWQNFKEHHGLCKNDKSK